MAAEYCIASQLELASLTVERAYGVQDVLARLYDMNGNLLTTDLGIL